MASLKIFSWFGQREKYLLAILAISGSSFRVKLVIIGMSFILF